MAHHYMFLKAGDQDYQVGRPKHSLAEVDEAICEMTGTDCPKRHISYVMSQIVDVGFACLMRGGIETTEAGVERFIDLYGGEWTDEAKDLLRTFLYRDWKMIGWG